MPIRRITPPTQPSGSTSDDGDGGGKRSRGDRTGDNWNENGSYKVGRGKPPPNRRWQPGQSGNPRGSAKKETPDIETLVAGVMEEPIVMTSASGVKKKANHAIGLIRKTYEKAVKGDLKAAQFLLNLYAKALERRSVGDASQGGLTADEDALLQAMLRGALSEGWPRLN
jgi:hypothetical protein